MKFGETLSRRSVPQWRTHDLEYGEIKTLIKVQTSSQDGCSREFEKTLLGVLDSELERIDEFVRCKAGEIERRLSACQRTVKTLSKEQGKDDPDIKQSSQSSLKRFFKIEAEIDRVSKDAQLLARYVSAQYTGFKKLLKKHAKWCRLSPNSPYSLSSQFVPHLETQRPFHRRVNFQHIMRQLSLLYNARLDSELSKHEKTSLEYLVDDNLDHTLQSSVTYWVHADNQVETQLFLLKHLVLQLDSSPVSCKEIHRSTRTAYLDSKDWRVYSSLLPESQTSQTVKPKAPQILWEEKSRNKDVLIVIPEGNDHKSLPLKRKNLSTFLSSKRDELDLTSPEWGSNTKDWIQKAEDVHDYIQSSSLHPVIQVSTDRTSFVKVIRNSTTSTTSRVYATLDRNVCSTLLTSQVDFINLDGEEDLVNLEGYKNVFPHAVLQIRWEGDSPRWLEELNASHLIERINGFSMYPHAVATLVPSQVSKLPYWMPLLQKDIRKLQPPLPSTIRRRESASPFVTTDSKTSSSQEALASAGTAPSSRNVEPAYGRKQRTYIRDNGSGYGSTAPSSPIIYWSEFENPEEEPFTVPIDEASPLIPWFRTRKQQQRDIERQEVYDETSFFSRTMRKIRGVVESEMKTSADGLTTLFYEKRGDYDDEEEDEYNSEDSSEISPVETTARRRLSAPPHEQAQTEQTGISRAELLNRGYSLCVVGCTMLLAVFGVVGLVLNGEATGIAFVLVGSLISLTLEIVSLVRFIMQGGHSGVAWIGLLVVVLAGAAFIPLVAWAEEG